MLHYLPFCAVIGSPPLIFLIYMIYAYWCDNRKLKQERRAYLEGDCEQKREIVIEWIERRISAARTRHGDTREAAASQQRRIVALAQSLGVGITTSREIVFGGHNSYLVAKSLYQRSFQELTESKNQDRVAMAISCI